MAASALKNDVFTLVIVLILLVAGTFLFSRNKFQNLLFPAGHIKRTPTIPANAKTEDVAVSGSNFTFTPKEITVTKGNKIKITFKNTGGEHNFTIPDLNVKTKTIHTGEQGTIEFFADKAGTFPFYCSYEHHKEFGMTGKLIIK